MQKRDAQCDASGPRRYVDELIHSLRELIDKHFQPSSAPSGASGIDAGDWVIVCKVITLLTRYAVQSCKLELSDGMGFVWFS